MGNNQLFLLLTLLIILIFELIIDITLLKTNFFRKIKNKKINNRFVMDIFTIVIVTIGLNLFLYIPEFNYWKLNNNIFINFCYVPIIIIINLMSAFRIAIWIWSVFSISIIGYSFIFTNNIQNTLVLITIHLSVILILGLIIYSLSFLKNKHEKNFLINIAITTILFVINASIFNKYEFKNLNYIAISLCFAIEIILYYVINWFIPFIKNLNHLNLLKNYEKNFFYSFHIARDIIREKIRKNNLKYGLVMIFDYINISRLPILWGNSKTNEIKEIIINELLYAFKDEDVIFFMTTKNEYAAFISLRNKKFIDMFEIYKNNSKQIRPITDPFCKLQLKLLDIPKIISFDNKTQKIYTGIYSSVYGVHSCNIDQLIELARYTKQKSLTSKKGGIVLDIFNPLNWSKFNESNNEYDLNQYFNSNNIEIKITNNKFNKIDVIDFHVSCIKKLLLNYDEIMIYANNKNILEKTMRLIAMESLKELQKINTNKFNKKINLQYPINYILGGDFSINSFKEKINFLNLKLENIILEFDLNYLSNENLNKINFLNLQNLKNSNCTIKFKNFDLEHLEILNYFKPDWIDLSNNSRLNCFINELKNDFNININNHW